jgi:hypothetical protein
MSEPTPPVSYTFEVPSRPPVFLPSAQTNRRYWLHLLLLLATFVSTLIVGTQLELNFRHNLPAFSTDSFVFPLFHAGALLRSPRMLLLGIPFSFTLMGILLAHELGHFFLCQKYGIYATLPYFLPAPTFIGTFGAVIRIKSPIRSRQALFDIGIAGPIAGFAAALPVLLWGLALSKPISVLPSEDVVQFGYPLIFRVFHWLLTLFVPHAAPLSALNLHPIALAAWVGMFATALNLLPGGQLDGGHIVYAFSPRAHRWVSRVSIVVLLLLGTFFWTGWLLWGTILGFTGMRHPNVPKWPGLDAPRRWLFFAAILLLVLTFAFAPMKGYALFNI